MISAADSLRSIHEWIGRLRVLHPLGDVIRIVSKRFEAAEGDSHLLLGAELTWLLREAERYGEALQVLDVALLRHPDDVRLAISKANLYFYSFDQSNEALKWIEIALERAYRTRHWRREVLGEKARILLDLNRGDELSAVLEEIMALEIIHDIPDIGRERDFVDRAPPGLIRQSVLERYNEFRPKRASDSSSDGPPPFEIPDDAV